MIDKNNQIEKAKQYASQRGGFCLSTVEDYKGVHSYLKWKCSEDSHVAWESTYNCVINYKTWCKQCNLQKKKFAYNGLEKAYEIAKKRNGECLSKEYINKKSKLLWKCHIFEHKPWQASLNHIVHQDQWCPQCASSKNKTENRVRLFLETFFKFSLSSSYPVWNINPKTGKLLELDGYNEENKIAFEHDGQHHFEHTLYSPSVPKEEILTQLIRDKVKKENCKKLGIKLISIPILNDKTRYKFFPLLRHVIYHCKRQGINLSYTYSQIKEMKKGFHSFSPPKREINGLLKIRQDKDFFNNLSNFETIEEILIHYQYNLKRDYKRELRKYIASHLGENHAFQKPLNGKINYPDLATLESMIKEQGYSAVGRILGCSSNAVKKYIKRKIPSFTLKDEKR